MPDLRRLAAVGGLVIATLATSSGRAAETALWQQVEAAVTAGEADRALLMLEPLAAEGGAAWRYWRARACFAAGRLTETARLIDLHEGRPAADWPVAWRGAVEALAGEYLLASGAPPRPAAECLARAIDHGGRAVAIDRCLLLIAQALHQVGDVALAERYAARLWSSWVQSPYRPAAGVLLADLVAPRDRRRAREILAMVRVLPACDEDSRRAALDRACGLIWRRRPGTCRDLARGALQRWPGDAVFRRWQAVADAVLDPAAGQQSLRDLPVSERQHPVVIELLQRRAADNSADDGHHAAWETARRLVAAGDAAAACAAVIDLVTVDEVAARFVVQHHPRPEELAEVGWIDRPVLRVLLADRCYRGGQVDVARQLILTSEEVPVEVALQARCWYLRAQLTSGPVEQRAAWQHLRELDWSGPETGEAWVQRARERGLTAAERRQAWQSAAMALPPAHPWAEQAARQLARSLLRPVPPGTVVTDWTPTERRQVQAAVPALARVAWRGEDSGAQELRFLLLQAQAQLGRPAEARVCLEALRAEADTEEQQRLDSIAERLGH